MKSKWFAFLLVLCFIFQPFNAIQIVVDAEDHPVCDCGNQSADLSVHADGCARKSYCHDLSKYSITELFEMWDEFDVDVAEFVLVYLSWTNWQKYQDLSQLLENREEIPDEPEPPLDDDELNDGCICTKEYPYGSVEHHKKCPYHFSNLTIDDEYVVYITMSDQHQTSALNSLDLEKRGEFEAYLSEHPYVHTVSEDGIHVTAADVPSGSTLTAEVVSHEVIEPILPNLMFANNVIFSLDIKIFDESGNQWQPEDDNSIMLKVSMPDAKTGEKTDFVHMLDTVSSIEEGIQKGTVKFKSLNHLFEIENEAGEMIEVIPELPESYWKALESAAQLGYERQIAYEILTGTCVDDGYSTLYTKSFSTFSTGSLDSGTYYINHDLTGLSNHTGAGSNWKGFYTEKNKKSQLHGYYYSDIGNVTIPSGNTVNFIFVKGNVPISGTVTVQGTLNVSLFNSPTQRFWKFHWSSIWESERDLGSSYAATGNTVYRSSGNTGHLFNVYASGVLNLSGISTSNPFIIDGKSLSSSGAAIYSTGRINLDYVTVKNVVRTGSGAVYMSGSSSNTLDYVNIDNCEGLFGGGLCAAGTGSHTLNYVNITNCRGTDGTGIVISSTAGTFTANNCNISGCNTTDENEWGGTIRTTGATVSSAQFNNCNIYNNNSMRHGGAFYWNAGGTSKLSINNCNIYNNTAGKKGGGIFCEAVMEIKGNTSIYNNTAGEGGGGICVNAYGGGTPNMLGSELILSNTIKIENNSTSQNGGGIFMNVYRTNDLIPQASFKIQLNGAKINGNTAANGGAVYVYRNTDAADYQCLVDLNYGELKNNTATSGNGGGVYVDGVNVSVGNNSGSAMTISGNKAVNGVGGAIYSVGTMGTCSVTNGTLTGNNAGSGGAIGIINSVVNVSGGTINSNSSSIYGGAIYSSGVSGSCTISNGAIESNTSKYGGAIVASDSKINVNGGQIDSNTASVFGGGIYATGDSASVTVSGQGSISNNSAANGGGVYAIAGADVNITGGVVSYNTAKGTPNVTTAYNDAASSGVGGGIYVGNGTSSNSSSISISGSSVGLYGNTADFAAADAYASGVYTLVTVPAVKNMNLTNFTGSATGWFEDYVSADTGYSYGVMGGASGERYAKARNAYELTSANSITKYTAITLGTSKSGYGNLTIQKTGSNIDPNQVFLFEVTGKSFTLFVSIVGENNITIYELPDGTYTVKEVTSWSWRYTPDQSELSATISGSNVNPKVTFNNSRSNNNWLTSSDDEVNVKGS